LVFPPTNRGNKLIIDLFILLHVMKIYMKCDGCQKLIIECN
jgi:hypothetical protein